MFFFKVYVLFLLYFAVNSPYNNFHNPRSVLKVRIILIREINKDDDGCDCNRVLLAQGHTFFSASHLTLFPQFPTFFV